MSTNNTETDFTSADTLLATNPQLYVRFEHSGKPYDAWKQQHLQNPNTEAKTTFPNLAAFVGSELNKNNRDKGTYFVQS